MTNEEMIQKAASVLRPKKIDDHWVDDVACALLSEEGNLYLGVCILLFFPHLYKLSALSTCSIACTS